MTEYLEIIVIIMGFIGATGTSLISYIFLSNKKATEERLKEIDGQLAHLKELIYKHKVEQDNKIQAQDVQLIKEISEIKIALQSMPQTIMQQLTQILTPKKESRP